MSIQAIDISSNNEVPIHSKIFTYHDINRIEMFMKEFKRLSGVNAVLYCSKSLVWNHTINEYIKNITWYGLLNMAAITHRIPRTSLDR